MPFFFSLSLSSPANPRRFISEHASRHKPRSACDRCPDLRSRPLLPCRDSSTIKRGSVSPDPAAHIARRRGRALSPDLPARARRGGRRRDAPLASPRPVYIRPPTARRPTPRAQPSSRSRSSVLCGGTNSRRSSAMRRATRARRSGSARRRPISGDQRSCARPSPRPCTTGEQRFVSARVSDRALRFSRA